MKKYIVVGLSLFLTAALSFAAEYARAKSTSLPLNFQEIGIDEAWHLSEKHSQGRGMRILDIDTGADISVSDINKKIDKGLYLGAYTRPPEDSNPFHDEDGHGTGIAGTLVGDLAAAGAAGVAPRARVLIGKLGISDNEVDFVHNITRGIRWGISEKVDVINLSIESDGDEPGLNQAYDELKLALHDAYEMGIAIVAASGNGGNGQLDFIARQPEVLSVGAVDCDFVRAPFSQYGPELGLVAPAGPSVYYYPKGSARSSKIILRNSHGHRFVPASASYVRSPITLVRGELQFVGGGSEPDFVGFISGNIAVVQQKIGAITDIADRAMKKGARGLIFINYTKELSTKYASHEDTESKIPIVFVNKNDGEIIKNLLLGEKIQALVKVQSSDFARFFGTSGAAPIVSGVAALMKAVNKNLRAPEIYRILRATATHVASADNEYGSGVVNAAAAVSAAIDYPPQL